MVSVKDDGGTAHQIVLDCEVQILVSFVEQGETCPGPTTRIEHQPACNARHRDGRFEDVDMSFEVILL